MCLFPKRGTVPLAMARACCNPVTDSFGLGEIPRVQGDSVKSDQNIPKNKTVE